MNLRELLQSEHSWTCWYRRALPAYWLILVCMTHFPKPELPGGHLQSDKGAHFAAFALLALLFWRFFETFQRPLSAKFVWTAGAVLGLYAAADEYTQQFVNRGVQFQDWLANMAGIVAALSVLEWRRRSTLKRRMHDAC